MSAINELDMQQEISNEIIVARMGTFIWCLSKIQEAQLAGDDGFAVEEHWIEQVKEALVGDVRVRGVWQDELDLHYSGTEIYYPSLDKTDENSVVEASDAFFGFHFNSPLFIEIKVPVKNQPRHHGADDVPSEDYLVCWDGVTAAVAWKQTGNRLPLSGGHVVFSVLNEALLKTGTELYGQACSPHCRNLFFHSIAVLQGSGNHGDDTCYERSEEHRGVDVLLPSADDLEDALTWLMLDSGGTASNFAEFKNKGRRLLDLHELAEQATAQVLALQLSEMSAAARGPWSKLRNIRRTIKRKQQTRLLLAKAWLCLAHVETLRRQWSDNRADLGDPDNKEFVSLFLADDFARDEPRIDLLDPETIRSALDSVSVQLGTRSVVVATVLGGLAGAVAGFVSTVGG